MKKIVLLFTLLIFFSGVSNAQLGLSKLKGAVKKETKKLVEKPAPKPAEKNTTTPVEQPTEATNEAPAEKTTATPVEETTTAPNENAAIDYSKLSYEDRPKIINSLEFLKGHIRSGFNQKSPDFVYIERSLVKMEEKLKEGRAEHQSVDISDYEKYYTDSRQKLQGLENKSDFSSDFISFLSSGIAVRKKMLEGQVVSGARVPYAEFVELKKGYAASDMDKSRYDERFAILENFYLHEFEEQQSKMGYGIQLNKYEEYLTQFRLTNPETALTNIERGLEIIEKVRPLAKDPNVSLNQWKSKLENYKVEVDEYVASGAYDKYKAEQRLKRVSQQRVPQPGTMNTAEYLALAKKGFSAERFGTPVKHMIISDNWVVKKNGLDYPIKKLLYANVIVKAGNGECEVIQGDIVRDYEGGGQYSKVYIDQWFAVTTVLCANVK